MNVFNAEGLRKARLEKRISQVDFGMKVGLSSATICRIERGERFPTAAEIEAFSKALDSTVMKKVVIPERDFSVATRLAGLKHRIKVEISLEQVRQLAGDAGSQITLSANEREPSALVFYVPLEGLAIDGFPNEESTEEEGEDTNQLRPRQR